MAYSDDLRKVVAIIACVMAVQMEGERLAIVETPSLKRICLARHLMFIVESQGRPQQKGLADDHLPAHVGSPAPIVGVGQEQQKEEVARLQQCKPSGRVADPGPMPKVSHHSCLDPKTLPPPSLKSCHPMCGPTSESKVTPHLSPAANPDAQEAPGLADGGWQSWLQQVASFLQA